MLFIFLYNRDRNRQTTGLLAHGSTYRNGTCMTAPECSQKGGSESGTCAGGYEIRIEYCKITSDS